MRLEYDATWIQVTKKEHERERGKEGEREIELTDTQMKKLTIHFWISCLITDMNGGLFDVIIDRKTQLRSRYLLTATEAVEDDEHEYGHDVCYVTVCRGTWNGSVGFQTVPGQNELSWRLVLFLLWVTICSSLVVQFSRQVFRLFCFLLAVVCHSVVFFYGLSG